MKGFTLSFVIPPLLLLAACAGRSALPATPEVLMPEGERPVARVSARGVQIYECRATKDGPAWVFVAPEAALFDAMGREAGRHYAGPHWEAPDGSRLLGTVKARAESPREGAIPWLLLSTRSVGGEGSLAGITSVQRVNTEGGLAPAGACAKATIGATQRVPYTADYVLLSNRARKAW